LTEASGGFSLRRKPDRTARGASGLASHVLQLTGAIAPASFAG